MNKTKPAFHFKVLGKILFPRQSPWQQAAKAATVFYSVVIGILTGGAIALVMLLHSSVGAP